MPAAGYMELGRPPELFCGFPRRREEGPTLYPVACSPQAWAAATPLALLQAVLGMHLDAVRNEIRFEQPHLPDSIQEVELGGLALGDSRGDVTLRRHDEGVVAHISKRGADARLVVVA